MARAVWIFPRLWLWDIEIMSSERQNKAPEQNVHSVGGAQPGDHAHCLKGQAPRMRPVRECPGDRRSAPAADQNRDPVKPAPVDACSTAQPGSTPPAGARLHRQRQQQPGQYALDTVIDMFLPGYEAPNSRDGGAATAAIESSNSRHRALRARAGRLSAVTATTTAL